MAGVSTLGEALAQIAQRTNIDEETRDLLQEELLLGLPDTTEETAAR